MDGLERALARGAGISGYACTISRPQPVRLWWRWVRCESAEMLFMWLVKQ